MQGEHDGTSPDESSQEDNPSNPGEQDTSSTSLNRWLKVRLGLTAIEAGFVLTQHDALALGARAIVVVGDLIFCRPRKK